jgi:biopolymer transport protein ExbB/TolQ/biopolymer transport protein ExbD
MLTNGLPRFGPSELPKANNPDMAPDAAQDDAIVLVVAHNGRVFWRNDLISVDGLRDQLRHRLKRDPRSKIFLAVDTRASYANVSTVVAAVRSVGVERVFFLVDQRKINISWTIYPQPSFWNVGELWRKMGLLEQADFLLLAFMLANASAILCFRLHRYSTARRESLAFTRDAAAPLSEGRFNEAMSIASRNSRSHLANIVAEVLAVYASAGPELTNAEAIALGQRSCQRRSKLLAAELKCGLGTFATIASSAPFIGFLGTIDGILGGFVGISGSRAGAMGLVALGLAEALLPGAAGIVVSILAVWCFYYVRSRCRVLESEMSNAEQKAIKCLKAHPEWREQLEHSSVTTGIFIVGDTSAGLSWEVPHDRQRALLLAFWGCALYVAFLLARAWS